MFTATYNQRTGWRIVADYTAIGGAVIDICSTTDERVARETAQAMNNLRSAK